MFSRFDDFVLNIQQGVAAGHIIADIASDAIAIIPGLGQIIDTVVDAIVTIAEKDVTDIRYQAQNSEWREWLTCWLYCHLPETGFIDQAVIDGWQNYAISLDPRGPLLTLVGVSFAGFVEAMNLGEIQRRAYLGGLTPSAECAALCGCDSEGDYEWEFLTTPEGWSGSAGTALDPGTGVAAVYQTSEGHPYQGGWQNTVGGTPWPRLGVWGPMPAPISVTKVTTDLILYVQSSVGRTATVRLHGPGPTYPVAALYTHTLPAGTYENPPLSLEFNFSNVTAYAVSVEANNNGGTVFLERVIVDGTQGE